MSLATRITSPAARHGVLVGLIVVAALSRLVPHPPNFSPVEAIALFAGAFFVDRRLAILVPLAGMALSDFFLGFHAGVPVVYGCIALMAWFGRGLAKDRSPLRIAGYGLASAVFFFVVTNFFTWAFASLIAHETYPYTFAGLVECYVAAIPFFKNQLAGVAFYCTVLFGTFALLERRAPRLAATA